MFIQSANFKETECINCLCNSLSADHRGSPVCLPALSVQGKAREAHRRCDAAGGPSRYGHERNPCLRAGAMN